MLLTRQLKHENLVKAMELAEMEQEVAAEVEDAVAFAEAGTWEPLADLERFVYSER